MPKRGRLGHDEMNYIRANARVKTAQEIGDVLDRSAEVVEKYIRDHVPPPKAVTTAEAEDAEKVTIRQELRNSEAWKNLKLEFFPDELKFFEETYIKMMAQLRDVLATEETQVFHACKYEVLMSRNLKQKKVALEDIGRIEDIQKSFLGQFAGDVSRMEDDQKELAMNIEGQLSNARLAEKNLTNEYAKLQERHSDLMKTLKSTRDQRVKQIETLNQNGFLPVIKALASRDEQERQGRQIELVKLAGKAEYVRLGRPRTYDDGADDNPILSAETVDLGREGEVETPPETSEEPEVVEA